MFFEKIRVADSPVALTEQRYVGYQYNNIDKIAQLKAIPEALVEEVKVTSLVFPFRVNSYVLDELIDWRVVPDDPVFRLLFPMSKMLHESAYRRLAALVNDGADSAAIQVEVAAIRASLNPHPSGQTTRNVPKNGNQSLPGLQHKYRETLLFFPSQGQYCHAYCTYCFRWAQFTAKATRMNNNDALLLQDYLSSHKKITDLLITGGDPMVMRAKKIRNYMATVLSDTCEHVKNVRIGTKSLAFWPARFVTDKDADQLLSLFHEVVQQGKSVAVMAHFSHPRELRSDMVKQAIRRLLEAGVTMRTQAPLLKGINDSPAIWIEMWERQVSLGMVPYYMFIDRDTGAEHYFTVTLARAIEIFSQAYKRVSGLSKTVRGPVMSADPGKVQILGVTEIGAEKVFCLKFIQARNPEHIDTVFFAQYCEKAKWLDDLKPAFGKKTFFWQE